MQTFDDFYNKYSIPGKSKEIIRAELLAAAKACFDEYPSLLNISFSGYTPEWNDGEPCEHIDFYGYILENGYFAEDDLWSDGLSENEFFLETDAIIMIPSSYDKDEIDLLGFGDRPKKLSVVLSGMKELVRSLHGTNYVIQFHRKDNGSDIVLSEDRGYPHY